MQLVHRASKPCYSASSYDPTDFKKTPKTPVRRCFMPFY